MQNKEKDMQPPYQKERKGLSNDEKIEEHKDGWQLQQVASEASQKDEDEIQREALRGDETKGNPNDRDNAGNVDSNETPQGREEAKNDVKGKANTNG